MNRPRPAELVLIGQNVPIGIAQVIVGAIFDNVPVIAIGAANAVAAVVGLIIVKRLGGG